MNRTLVLSCSLVIAMVAPLVHAQDAPRLEVSLDVIDGAGPFHRRLQIRSTTAQEVVRDRRLLGFTVRPNEGRRRHRCSHPGVPRRVAEERVARMEAGDAYEEWIDVRMYCWGRALAALEKGATLEPVYGFRSRGRNRWVARQNDERRPPHRVSGASVTWAATEEAASEAPVRVSLAPATARGTPRLQVRVKGSGRVYLRDDLWSFTVRGPLGSVTCQPARQTIVPIVDFFTRLGRRGRRATLDAALYCPAETFRVEGVYDVVPRLELVYDAEAFDFDAVTGTFEGTSTPVRVLRRGAPYVEQRVEDLLGAHEGTSDE